MSAAELFREIHHKKMLGTKDPNYEQAHVGLDLLTLISKKYRIIKDGGLQLNIDKNKLLMI